MIPSSIFLAARRGCLVVILIIAGISCQSLHLNYVGLQIPAENRIFLKDSATHQDLWQTEDLTIAYTYNRNDNRFKISGTIDFSDALTYNYTYMDYFDLWIHFVDAENIIIATRSISPIVTFYMIEKTSFERNLDVPPSATAFVFSYSGHASEGAATSAARDGGISWDFWKTPHG